jgi:hypothetical protein
VSLGRYVLIVLAVVAALLGAAWPTALRLLDGPSRLAVAAGAALAALNTTVAYFLVLWSAGRSTTVFLGAILGGMVGRMALVLGAVVALVLGLDLPKVPLSLSLLTFFVLFLVLELAILHRRTSAPAGVR